MKITQLKKKREIVYRCRLVDDVPGNPVLDSETYEAFKLQIQRRDTDDTCGEVNFLIRDKGNNLRYLVLYCFMDEPNEIRSVSYWVNNKVTVPPGLVETVEDLIDHEKAALFVMDFLERHVKKNYSFVS